MSFWENTFIGKYFGTQKQTQSINDSVVNMESDAFTMDSFLIGTAVSSYYLDSVDFVLLQEKNFILNNVISKISKKFSNATFTDENDSALLKKINNPNGFQSKEEFLKEFATYIISSGFTVIWKRYVSFGNFDTMELININPCRLSFNKDNVTFQYENQNITVSSSEIIIFYDIRRNHLDKKGYSRIIPLRSQLENISLAQKAKNIQINNSGTTIVSPKQTSAGSNIDEGLNAPVPVLGGGIKTQKDEMEDKLNNRGLENRIIVSSKGLDAINLSEKLNNIDFYKIVESDALAVYDAFSFPIELSPYGKNATFENKGQAELQLIENELMPLLNSLTNSLNSEFAKKGKITGNYNHIGVMSIIKNRVIDTNQKIITQYKTLFDDKIINEIEYKDILIENKILHG